MNPWLKIPHEDYEGHMSAPHVEQLQTLNEIFKNVIDEVGPELICVLGCTTGNGFEHLVGKNLELLIGVDINPEYLSVCKKRFGSELPCMELICADLNELEFADESFDLIHAALIFEYVDCEKVLSKIVKWLKPDGKFSVVLQMPSELSSPISETKYQSLKQLSPFMNLIAPETIREKLEKLNMKRKVNKQIDLPNGKKFDFSIYVKGGMQFM